MKYQLTAMQTAPGSFLLACNGSHIEATIRSLADGGYLVLMGGKSHVAYMKVSEGVCQSCVCVYTCREREGERERVCWYESQPMARWREKAHVLKRGSEARLPAVRVWV